METKTEKLQELKKLSLDLLNEKNASKAVERIVKTVRAITMADCCSLYVCDYLREKYRLIATDGLRQSAVGKTSLDFNEGLVGVVGTKKTVLNLADAKSHPNFKFIPEIGEEEFLSFLGVPAVYQDKLYAVLVVQSKDKKQFNSEDESIMVSLCAQIALYLVKQEDSAENRDNLTFKRVAGLTSTGDYAVGTAFVWNPAITLEDVQIIHCEEPAIQQELFHQALFQLQLEMDRNALKMEQNDNKDAVFGYLSAYGRLLDDPLFESQVDEKILNNGLMATSAIKLVVEEKLKEQTVKQDQELATEILEFADVLISRLIHIDVNELDFKDKENIILIVKSLPTSLIAELPRNKINGLIATSKETSSHATILAKDLGITSILGVPLNFKEIDGHSIVLDASACEVLIDPPSFVVDEFSQLIEEHREKMHLFKAEKLEKVVTLDGQHISVALNAGLNHSDLKNINRLADGIGLYRTEIAFMLASSFPSEAVQCSLYEGILKSFEGKRVCLRTLDVGSDKSLPYLPIKENNPAFGWRGVRLTLDLKHILEVQLKAMLRANISYNNLDIMIPMVSRVEEIEEIKNILSKVKQEIEDELNREIPMPRFGVMIEVPSIAYILEDITPYVDFFSVGSNDLIQYLLAVDRSNHKVSKFYDPFHPAVVRCLYYFASTINKKNKDIVVCGEMAGNPLCAMLLLSLGYKKLSMNYKEIARVKYTLRRVSVEKLELLGKDALHLKYAKDIRSLYENYANELGLLKDIE